MSGAQGNQYLAYISDDGTATGTMLEIDVQGDLGINLGKDATRTKYKNAVRSNITDNGKEFTLSIGDEFPKPASHAKIWDHHEDESDAYCEFVGKKSGMDKWVGLFKVVITDANKPTQGEGPVSVKFSESETAVRSTVA